MWNRGIYGQRYECACRMGIGGYHPSSIRHTLLSSSHACCQTLTGTEELSYLAGAIQLIIFELSANLDTLTNAILDGDGVYRWTSTAQEQLGRLQR